MPRNFLISAISVGRQTFNLDFLVIVCESMTWLAYLFVSATMQSTTSSVTKSSNMSIGHTCLVSAGCTNSSSSKRNCMWNCSDSVIPFAFNLSWPWFLICLHVNSIHVVFILCFISLIVGIFCLTNIFVHDHLWVASPCGNKIVSTQRCDPPVVKRKHGHGWVVSHSL